MNTLRIILAAVLCASLSRAAPAERTVDRLQTEARGFYLLWSEGRPDADQLLALPYVRGGQIVMQWAQVEPAPGRYDFAAIDRALARFSAAGKWTTLQVNGNSKPRWLFEQVPYVRERLSEQVRDSGGTLMFWHPRFQEAHLAMLRALAAHLQASPNRNHLLGVRLNFNAVGTEHFAVPAALHAPDKWIVPPGVRRDSLVALTPAVQEAYADRVVALYDTLFADWATIFVRNNLSDELRRKYADKFARGRLALFHTSSEAEPRGASTERQYAAFLDFCRSGQTVAYAEPWASAWGEHGGMTDLRWCSPAQWNYWTLLLNLHCGVSFIGEYYANLHFAISGEHNPSPPIDPRTDGPSEFRAAYEWAAKYVGRHNRPAESPGAWVAFRANEVAHRVSPRVAEAGRKLTRLTGDYTWLAERLADESVGVGPIGPAEQRFGAFARRYRAGQAARVRLDDEFVRSLTGDVIVRIISLGEGAAAVAAGGMEFAVDPSPRQWRVSELRIPAGRLTAADHAAPIEIRAVGGDLILHLVEVERGVSPSKP